MEKIKLSEGLLDLILYVQSFRKTLIRKYQFEKSHGMESPQSWENETQNMFNNINPEILRLYGLGTNHISFHAVCNFNVTDEMRQTEYNELGKYDCWQSCI